MSRFRETKMVSFKLDLQTLAIIEQVAKDNTRGNRTWAIETIINEYAKTNQISTITKTEDNEK